MVDDGGAPMESRNGDTLDTGPDPGDLAWQKGKIDAIMGCVTVLPMKFVHIRLAS